MRVDISAAHNAARLAGTLAFMSAGSGNATIELYGTDEVDPGAPAGDDPLVTLVLAKPPATLVDGVLVLHQADDTGDVILTSGIAKWARWHNGAGVWMQDTDAGEETEDADGPAVQLPTTILRAGGRCPMSPSTIG